MQAFTHTELIANTRKAALRYDAEARECETRGEYTRAEELFQSAEASEAEANRLEAAGPAAPDLVALNRERPCSFRPTGSKRTRRRQLGRRPFQGQCDAGGSACRDPAGCLCAVLM